MPQVTLRIESIQVVNRHRKELGDIDTLAKSIDDIGLINPITVTAENRLIAGERRLAAARLLGWTEIQTNVITNLDDAASMLRAERDINSLVDRLSKHPGGPGNLLGKAGGLRTLTHSTMPRAVAEYVVDMYNARRKSKSIPQWRAA